MNVLKMLFPPVFPTKAKIANISGVDVRGKILEPGDMVSCVISKCDFRGTVATHSKLFESSEFVSCDFRGAEWQGITFANVVIRESDLSGANFSHSLLPMNKLTHCNAMAGTFIGVTFDKSDFWDVNFNSADLRNSKIQDCVFSRGTDYCSFVCARLDGTTFERSVLTNTDFKYSSARNCNFNNTILAGCDFRGATLTDSSFVGADLSGCDFRGAKLHGCVFGDADFSNTQIHHNHYKVINGRFVSTWAKD